MSRISTYATSLTLNQYMLSTQARTFRAQEQLTSGMVSQSYTHIALQTQQLIYNEATRSTMATYVKDNETANLRMQIQSDTLGGITSTIDDFRKTLRDFDVVNASETESEYIQSWAFRTMRDLQSYLNTQSDGRYMFSGSKINTPSVDLQLTTLAAFQARYDGYINEYPTTRDAHLARAELSSNTLNDASATINPDNWLRFSQDSDGDAWTSSDSSIVATPGMFSNLSAGTTIQIGSTSSND
ncbi:MAG: hypothetical protein KAI73_09055, partial [Rhodospirillaceae bacterium]|nr:hypothetical protein [Rhodospirillaceae bacterium]